MKWDVKCAAALVVLAAWVCSAGSGTGGVADVPPEIELSLPQQVTKDPYGGLADDSCAEGTGFFTTGECDGRMYLLTPEGNRFFSFGMSAYRFGGPVGEGIGYSPAKLNETAAFAALGDPGENKQNWWIEQKVATASEYGFNTIAGWGNSASKLSMGKVPGTYSFGFASGVASASYVSSPIPTINEAGFPDVFHPDFSAMCLEYAGNRISAEMKEDPWNIGYFADNELHWWGQSFWLESGVYSLTDDFFTLPATSAGKIELAQYFGQVWEGDVDGFNDAYGLAVTSFDDLLEMTELPYEAGNQTHYEDRMGFVALVAEEYFANVNDALKAVDPDHLNLCVRVASIAPDEVVTAMAKYCDVITDWLLAREHEGLGYITGIHWFMHQDQPPTGRWDGENSNYGIVTVRNERYRWLLEGMAALHSATESYLTHGDLPDILPPPEEITVDLIDSESYQVSWTPAPGAQEYRVAMLSHPAGLENRALLSTETSGDNALVYQDFELGHLWVAVETLHSDALHAGFTVAGPLPIDPWPGFQEGCPDPAAVLDCETLCGTTSQFVSVRACAEGGNCPLEWPLSALIAEPGVASTASLEAAEALDIHSLVFFVNLYEDNLPMEQPLVIYVDSLRTE